MGDDKKQGCVFMVQKIMRDVEFLKRTAEPATAEDVQVADDLLETLKANADRCVGMAANMIGVKKRIIAFLDESGKSPVYTVMLNPEIIKKDGAYDTEESCLSLLGGPRPCRRYKTIKVRYMTTGLQVRIKTFTGFTAQIIQHEADHCDGVLI
jgi:peptide deformylase